nr:NUDIX domain-containing protein [Antrihabitans stalactiti]
MEDYPRPSVAVDVAVLTVADGELKVLVVKSPRDGLALPGTFVHPGETTQRAAVRALAAKAGLLGIEFHQLGVFDDPQRDYRGWVISVAHGAALPLDRFPVDSTLISIVNDVPVEDLAYDHAQMVTFAVADLRERYARAVDPDRLLGEAFTVLGLRQLYEAIYARPLPKDTFRRQLVDGLVSAGQLEVGGGRPAELFRRLPNCLLPRSAASLFYGDYGRRRG